MYEQHFGFHTMPFRVVPSPSFLFPSDTHEESRARILYGIRENRGFVVVTGAVGLGKTTVLLSVLEELEDTLEIALVVHPVQSFRELLRLVCLEFGVQFSSDDEVTMLWELNLFLVERLSEGKNCVLMIDEAQNLPVEVLERVRTLSNLQTESSSLLQIVLVGQPELMVNLDDPRLPQLRQRVGVWHEIGPLDREETRNYIRHRLKLAGAADPSQLTPDAVCDRVFAVTHGIPRLVNQVCDTALVIAYGRDARALTTEHVDEARRELRIDEAPTRSSTTSKAATSAVPESVVPDPEPAPTIPIAPEATAGRNRWLPPVAAVVILALLVLAAVRFGFVPDWPLTWATAADETVATEETLVPATEERAVRAADTRPVPESWIESVSEVHAWRERGRPVYTAYVASFRDSDAVARFADELVVDNADWSAPLFVETTADDPPWHRVYSGAYAERSDAQRFAKKIKQDGSVDFAHVKRLAPSAENILPSVFTAPAETNPGESG